MTGLWSEYAVHKLAVRRPFLCRLSNCLQLEFFYFAASHFGVITSQTFNSMDSRSDSLENEWQTSEIVEFPEMTVKVHGIASLMGNELTEVRLA